MWTAFLPNTGREDYLYTGSTFGEKQWCLINHDIYKLVQSRCGMVYYSRICMDSWEKSQLYDDGKPKMSDAESPELESRKLN